MGQQVSMAPKMPMMMAPKMPMMMAPKMPMMMEKMPMMMEMQKKKQEADMMERNNMLAAMNRQQEADRMMAMQKKQQASRFTDYDGTMESDWMKTIPNWAICNWFYTFFVVNLIVVVLVIGGATYALVSKRGAKLFTPTNTFFSLLQLVVAGTNTLFYFLICDRSLKPAL